MDKLEKLHAEAGKVRDYLDDVLSRDVFRMRGAEVRILYCGVGVWVGHQWTDFNPSILVSIDVDGSPEYCVIDTVGRHEDRPVALVDAITEVAIVITERACERGLERWRQRMAGISVTTVTQVPADPDIDMDF